VVASLFNVVLGMAIRPVAKVALARPMTALHLGLAAQAKYLTALPVAFLYVSRGRAACVAYLFVARPARRREIFTPCTKDAAAYRTAGRFIVARLAAIHALGCSPPVNTTAVFLRALGGRFHGF